MLDPRKLLKDVVRGMVYEWDVPAVPAAVDEDGITVESTQEELQLFFALVDEVIAEEQKVLQAHGGFYPSNLLHTIAALKDEYLN